MATSGVGVYIGEALGRYGFGEGHPFGSDRMDAFWREARRQGLEARVTMLTPVMASQADIERFHTHDYVEKVKALSAAGGGYLDAGDTPAFPGVFEAAATVVGSGLDGLSRVMAGEFRRVFIPIGGLHHARSDRAAGFCVFNDCGVVIDALRELYGVERVGYVDIDAHHGDGVFYAYVHDPYLVFADIHEDGRALYPGTGSAAETGTGEAAGTKLNIPMPPGADDAAFFAAWEKVEDFLISNPPEVILFQCGADSIANDPITHLAYTPAAHAHAATRLCHLAEKYCAGRLLAFGGGGYDRDNLARAWSAVVESLVEAPVRA